MKSLKREETFHSILKRIDEGILGHSTRKSSIEKMKVGDLVLNKQKAMVLDPRVRFKLNWKKSQFG